MIMYSLPLHLLWLMATTTQIIWAEGDAPSEERVTMDLLPWRDDAEDRQYVRSAYEKSATLRTALASPGYHVINEGDALGIQSTNHPSDYPASSYQKWIFEPAPDVKIIMECPTIRIPPSPRCRNDKFVIFTMPRFRRGTRWVLEDTRWVLEGTRWVLEGTRWVLEGTRLVLGRSRGCINLTREK
ncbi:uncharacterized protein [Panulirus ornatus]|uniref:uncharacterized protein n=1 Tax=Panulirus ornatus TaxID=150431 RepID=UPI003A851A59